MDESIIQTEAVPETPEQRNGDVEEPRVDMDVSDRFIIEDMPEEEHVHDQLPSVEEAKANIAPRTTKSKKRIMVASIVIVLIVAVGTILALATGKKEEPPMVLTGRGEEVIEFLFDLGVSPLPALKDYTFAQHKAAVFVADGDNYSIDYNESPEAAQRFIERFVLVTLFYHFNGPRWSYNLNFLSAQDHCKWFSIFETPTSGKTILKGVRCNDDGFVTSLKLDQNNLVGISIPDEIKSLVHLDTLHMYFNTIGGEIPSAFRGMKKLEGIALMQTGLVGTIPDWIGEMGQLTTLALGNNRLHGMVPLSISNLHNLEILGLDDNTGLTGNINRFKGLYSLQALYLEDNAFTGQLPGGSSWPNLVELDISNNIIDESVPASLINHNKLAVLDLHNNRLTGTFPDDIFENTALKVLALQQNAIGGTLPDRLPFLKNLEHLDVSFNALRGTFPDDVSQLTAMRYWSTTNNRFSEQSMPNLSRMTNLEDLSMKHNKLTGPLPDWLGGLDKLRMLDLDSNELTGSIPSWLGLLPNLKAILFNRNQLTGTIPTQLANLQGLDVLLLDGNAITGNAEAICEANTGINPKYFTADCYPGQNGERPEIDCRCCTTCCIDSDKSCNNYKWTSIVDPVWEYGFLRPNYVFSLANAPAAYSKEGDAEPSDPIEDAFDSRRYLAGDQMEDAFVSMHYLGSTVLADHLG
jgi:Leucine-rich repeat (LRR) protein